MVNAINAFVAGDKTVDKAFIQNIANKMNLPHVLGTDKALREDFIKALVQDDNYIIGYIITRIRFKLFY